MIISEHIYRSGTSHVRESWVWSLISLSGSNTSTPKFVTWRRDIPTLLIDGFIPNLFASPSQLYIFISVQVAGNDVKRATDMLVRAAATNQGDFVIEIQVETTKERKMHGIRQEREAENDVNRIERELEEARMKLLQARKNKHKEKKGMK